MGMIEPYFERTEITLGSSQTVVAVSGVIVTNLLNLGFGDSRSNMPFDGVLLNFTVTISGGTINSALYYSFYSVHDDGVVDSNYVETSLDSYSNEVASTSLDQSGTSRVSRIALTKNLGYKIQIKLGKSGNRTMVVTTKCRRWCYTS